MISNLDNLSLGVCESPSRRGVLRSALSLSVAGSALSAVPSWAAAPKATEEAANPAKSVGQAALASDGSYICASSYSDSVFHTENLRAFASQLREATGGSINIGVTSNATRMPMSKVLPALKAGELAFGEVLMSSYSEDYPLLEFDALPFVTKSFADAATMWKATRDPISRELLSHGIRLLYVTPWPAQGLFSKIPIQRLNDLRGLKFRTYNKSSNSFAVGAQSEPVQIQANELQAAIETGKVDAMITSTPTAVDSLSWRAMNYYVPCSAFVPKNMVCISEAVWKTLKLSQQQALLVAAADAELRGWKMAREADERAMATLMQHKLTVVPTTPELRRSLDIIGERFVRNWVNRVGFTSASIFLSYYNSLPS